MRSDPTDSIAALDALAAGLEGRARQNLATVRRRMVAEMTGDVDGVLATLAPEFTLVSVRPDGTTTAGPRGQAEIRRGFVTLCGGGTTTIWVDWNHIVIDNRKFIGVGGVRMVMNADVAAVVGHPVDDATARYVVSSYSTVVVDFDADARMTCETVFGDPAATRVRVAAPDEHFDNRALATAFALDLRSTADRTTP